MKTSAIWAKQLLLFSLLLFADIGRLPAQPVSDSTEAVIVKSGPASTDSSLFKETNQRDISGYFYRVFLIGGFLLLVLFLGLNWYKKNGARSSIIGKGKIRILSRHHIGPRQSIAIVVADGKKYLVGITDHSINLIDDLGEVSDQENTENPESAEVTFGSLLKRIKKNN